MSGDQDGCEWVSVSSGTGLPGSPGPKAVKRLCVCVCVCDDTIYIGNLGDSKVALSVCRMALTLWLCGVADCSSS